MSKILVEMLPPEKFGIDPHDFFTGAWEYVSLYPMELVTKTGMAIEIDKEEIAPGSFRYSYKGEELLDEWFRVITTIPQPRTGCCESSNDVDPDDHDDRYDSEDDSYDEPEPQESEELEEDRNIAFHTLSGQPVMREHACTSSADEDSIQQEFPTFCRLMHRLLSEELNLVYSGIAQAIYDMASDSIPTFDIDKPCFLSLYDEDMDYLGTVIILPVLQPANPVRHIVHHDNEIYTFEREYRGRELLDYMLNSGTSNFRSRIAGTKYITIKYLI